MNWESCNVKKWVWNWNGGSILELQLEVLSNERMEILFKSKEPDNSGLITSTGLAGDFHGFGWFFHGKKFYQQLMVSNQGHCLRCCNSL
jgi:hypothetical protein